MATKLRIEFPTEDRLPVDDDYQTEVRLPVDDDYQLRIDFLSMMTSELERYQRNKYGDQKSEQQKENTYVFGYML